MEKDIVKAIEAEKEYIADIDHNTFPLIDRVKQFGFETLDEYFYTKVRYQIYNENLTLEYWKMNPGADKTIEYLLSGKAGALTTIDNEFPVWIYAGKDNQYLNVEKANELGYPIRNFNYNGGPIITTNEDFSLTFVVPNYIDFNMHILYDDIIIKLLKEKGYTDIVIDNNDILVNGKKVLGAIRYALEKATLYAFQFSLSNHEDLIKQLSMKESLKTPGYISNITRGEVEEELNKWLHSI